MARQKNNIVMKGARGMFGGQVVFKKRGGRPYVAAPPEIKEGRKSTPAQLAIQQRFKDSTEYAAEALLDPETKKAYQAKAKSYQSAHNIAVLDAFYPPEVFDVNAIGYKGLAGDVIVIQAQDDFKVMAVKVSIRNSVGELIEEGAAIEGKKQSWNYSVTTANANISGTKITATAVDLPGNEGMMELVLS